MSKQKEGRPSFPSKENSISTKARLIYIILSCILSFFPLHLSNDARRINIAKSALRELAFTRIARALRLCSEVSDKYAKMLAKATATAT